MKFRMAALCRGLRQRAGLTGPCMLDCAEQPPECVGFDPSGRTCRAVWCAPHQCWGRTKFPLYFNGLHDVLGMARRPGTPFAI